MNVQPEGTVVSKVTKMDVSLFKQLKIDGIL